MTRVTGHVWSLHLHFYNVLCELVMKKLKVCNQITCNVDGGFGQGESIVFFREGKEVWSGEGFGEYLSEEFY